MKVRLKKGFPWLVYKDLPFGYAGLRNLDVRVVLFLVYDDLDIGKVPLRPSLAPPSLNYFLIRYQLDEGTVYVPAKKFEDPAFFGLQLHFSVSECLYHWYDGHSFVELLPGALERVVERQRSRFHFVGRGGTRRLAFAVNVAFVEPSREGRYGRLFPCVYRVTLSLLRENHPFRKFCK